MIYKIALLLKPYVLDYCQKNIKFSSPKVHLDYYTYQSMDEFEELCRKICADYDGIITSGALPDLVLSHQDYAKNIARGYFDFDIENTYRLILSELLLQPELTISDISIDLLYGTEETLDQMILENRFNLICKIFKKNYRSITSYECMEYFETQLAEHYIKRFREHKIKFVLTCSLTVSELLHSQGYSCKYILPSFNTMHQVLNEVCHQLDIRNMEGHLPAIIRVDLHPTKEDQNDYSLIQQNIELKKNITEFVQLKGNKLTLRCNANSFEIYSNQNTICELTCNYTACCLSSYIDPSLYEKVSIGYGLGFTFYDAHNHAVTASDYAYNSEDKTHSCFLIDENGQLIRMTENSNPSPGGNMGISNDALKKLSLDVKLSINTLIKIMNVLKSEKTTEISSVELINHLGVSLRTANHYLSNLEKYGKATIVGQKRPNGKGRSINIYHLCLF